MYSQNDSLTGGARYPRFPKHGPPRILITLGWLSVPIAVISLWVLSLTGAVNDFNKLSLNSNASTPAVQKITTPRERGLQAGFDYAVRVDGTTSRKNLDDRRIKTLASQMAQTAGEDKVWQDAWVDGFKRGIESSTPRSTPNQKPKSRPTPLPLPTPRPLQESRQTRSNGLIRGPRGGCYYISGSGNKVYVDRSLCN